MKIEIELIKMYKSNLFIKISTEIFILTMDLSSHKKKKKNHKFILWKTAVISRAIWPCQPFDFLQWVETNTDLTQATLAELYFVLKILKDKSS